MPAFEAARALGTQTAFGSVADVLAHRLPSAPVEAVNEIARSVLGLLDQSHITPVSMRRLGVACGRVRIDSLRADPEADRAELARLLSNQSVRLGEIGRREDALEATQEAVTIYRDLARERPDAFLPDLASSLNNLGNRLNALGQPEDALEATQEAVTIYRDLARERPDAFLPYLASSLNNLGNRQAERVMLPKLRPSTERQ